MTVDKTIFTIMAVLLTVIIIPAGLFFRKPPGAELTASEKELISFSNPAVTLSPPRAPAVFSGLESPVKADKKAVQAANIQAKPAINIQPPLKSSGSNPAESASRKLQSGTLSSLPRISMIYSEGDTNMAIIGGQILHEGSTFGSYQVVKIDKTRVLVRSAGKNIWLNMD